ncbi:MAG: helix-turn-helix domain-containing protein, partial [Puniceicoccales bacterium]
MSGKGDSSKSSKNCIKLQLEVSSEENDFVALIPKIVEKTPISRIPMKEVNQQVIADALNLSRATVSRCFTNHPGINPETR